MRKLLKVGKPGEGYIDVVVLILCTVMVIALAVKVLPVYVAMDTFTVNLVPESGDQFVQLILSVEVADAPAGERIKTYTPKIRNNVTLLLSSQKASELLPKEGKEKLAAEIMDEINSAINPPVKNKKGEQIAPDGPVTSVLFTSFIIQ